MVATRRRVRASALVTALVIVLAGCTSEQTLAPDPAGAEPGYPQYTPPATSPDGVSPGGTPTADADPGAVPGTDAEPPATPSPEPTLEPTPAPSPSTPTASAEPEPTGAPVPSSTAPATPPPTPAPTTPPPTTPAPTTPTPLTLQTRTWQPTCGAALTAPAAANDLSVAVTLPATASGELLATDAVLTNGSASPLAGEVYIASVTIARDGRVVSTWVEGGDSVEPISIAARGTLVVPVDHDLFDSCGTPGTVAPEPPPAAVSTTAPATGTTDVAPPPSEGPAAGGTATGGVPTGSLPPGSYTAVVAIHVVRDGGMAANVVATSGVVPLTITDPS